MMQPLKLLTNVQKARLLHSLMGEEMPGYIAYLQEYAEAITGDEQRTRANWKNAMLSVEWWLELATEAQKKINRYGKDLAGSANVFAEQLFGDYLAVFSIHALTNFVREEGTDIKFIQAVYFLFT